VKEGLCISCGEETLVNEDDFCEMCIAEDLQDIVHYSDEHREAYIATFLEEGGE